MSDDLQWCPVHKKHETPEEFRDCDRELYEKGYRNIAGLGPMLVEEPNE